MEVGLILKEDQLSGGDEADEAPTVVRMFQRDEGWTFFLSKLWKYSLLALC